GHDVTVYATGDSRPPGRLRFAFAAPVWPPDFDRERQHARHAWLDSSDCGADIVHLNVPDALLESSGATPSVITVHHAADARRGAQACRFASPVRTGPGTTPATTLTTPPRCCRACARRRRRCSGSASSTTRASSASCSAPRRS